MSEWRSFCAIELTDEVRAQLQNHERRLREAVPEVSASWTRADNVHLTLKFFGNVEREKLSGLSDAAESVAKNFTSFQIRIGGTGVFPRPSRAQVLWIGVDDPSGRLSELQQRLEDEFDFNKEDRAYRPHLTIARIRKPEGARRLADAHLQMQFETIEVELKELVVFRSELSPKGSKYTAISAADLRA